MGAVQKLATTVIVGLVALSTLLVVYLANEPNRRSSETTIQDEVAIERGIETYIKNCVVCHGPAGEGYSEPGAEGTGRIGMPLGGNTELGLKATEQNQSEDANTRTQRYNLIVKTLNNGRGAMPAFGSGAEGGALLNNEEIHELALMIQNVNWNAMYNDVILADGGYPTFSPQVQAAAAPAAPAPTQAAGAPPVVASIASHDIYFEPKTFTVPADKAVTVTLPNQGASPHNFSIDALSISVDEQPGQTYSTEINAPAGDYEYYCNVPGHKEAGMVGTMTSDPNAPLPEAAPAAAASPAAGEAAASPAAEAASAPITVTSYDIYFDPKTFSVPADTDTVVNLPNLGAAPHNFSIDALSISVDNAAGETEDTVTINAPAGDYEYYCNIPGHKEAGMVGTMTSK